MKQLKYMTTIAYVSALMMIAFGIFLVVAVIHFLLKWW